jgi:hypothetical protein
MDGLDQAQNTQTDIDDPQVSRVVPDVDVDVDVSDEPMSLDSISKNVTELNDQEEESEDDVDLGATYEAEGYAQLNDDDIDEEDYYQEYEVYVPPSTGKPTPSLTGPQQSVYYSNQRVILKQRIL